MFPIQTPTDPVDVQLIFITGQSHGSKTPGTLTELNTGKVKDKEYPVGANPQTLPPVRPGRMFMDVPVRRKVP